MKEEKKKAIMNCETFDELLDQEYGPQGTPERTSFETEAEAFCLAETLKEQRLLAGLTQQELADKTGISMRSISRMEQGESVQINSLFTVLIALDLGDNIELLVPDQSKRPSYYLEKPEDIPKRVRKRPAKKEFKWGDEK